MKKYPVIFAGAGPGAVDLLTIRSRNAIADADVIVYAGSLVNPEVLGFAKAATMIQDSAGMTLEETTKTLVDAYKAGKKALRLHTGDPSMYGAIAEQMTELKKDDISYEVIPGVSSVFAAAATVACELTLPGSSQTMILTRRAGRTPVPEGQDIPSLAAHGATMGLYLSVADMDGLVNELIEGGYPPTTPVAVVSRASWHDEQIVKGTLGGIAKQTKAAGIRRQAIILVGDALSGAGEKSCLYAHNFAHGYRDRAGSVAFLGSIAFYGLTDAGCRIARRLSTETNGTAFLSKKYANEADTGFDPRKLQQLLTEQWKNYDAHVMVMATGIAVRKIMPLIKDKTTDPAVVVCDEQGQYSISLVGGHIAGANRLSRQIAALTGGVPVITTATDVQGIPAFDELAALQGWHIDNPEVIKYINSALLQKKPIGFTGPAAAIDRWYGKTPPIQIIETGRSIPSELVALAVLDDNIANVPNNIQVLRLSTQELVVGIGCRRNTPTEVISAAVEATLSDNAISLTAVKEFTSVEAKRDDTDLTAYINSTGIPITYYDADILNDVHVPTPSAMPKQHIGTPSVAEASALLHSGGRLLVPKQIHDGRVTVSVAVRPLKPKQQKEETLTQQGRIIAVGIGSGDSAGITPQARQALDVADYIVGYKTYCDQVRPFVPEGKIVSSGMMQEVARCRDAIKRAEDGSIVAMICSGDSGIYGMAGLLMELSAESEKSIEVEVIPGITAAIIAASALGAPLMNDFSIISLSDLLTERDTIINRLKSIARSDMPCALYNPRSRKRKELLDQALEIFSNTVGTDLTCGFVKNAGRPGETIWVGHLSELPVEEVDMFTTVIIGCSGTRIINNKLVTRRGYEKKYD